jgi:hypothetical protein
MPAEMARLGLPDAPPEGVHPKVKALMAALAAAGWQLGSRGVEAWTYSMRST